MRYKIYCRIGDIVATLAKDKEHEQELLNKGYALVGIAKINSKYDIFGLKGVKNDGQRVK